MADAIWYSVLWENKMPSVLKFEMLIQIRVTRIMNFFVTLKMFFFLIR